MSLPDVSAAPVVTPTYPPGGISQTIKKYPLPASVDRREKRKTTIKLPVHYPESDGMPMAENTVQYDHLTKIKGNLEISYLDSPEVFVAGDLFWYPVEGRNDIVYAPDVMIAFGRPKGDRGSYRQWEEDDIPPQVVFEIWSPGNRQRDKDKKFAFYNKYGVEEYYTYDPDKGEIEGWLRIDQRLQKISEMIGWQSPRLGIRFELEDTSDGPDMQLYYADGRPFLSHTEESKARAEAETKAQEAEAKVEKAEAKAEEAEAKVEEAESRAKMEAEARSKAEAEAERTQALLQAAMEQLQKAGLPLPDVDG